MIAGRIGKYGQELHAGAGSETLNGLTSGPDTLYGGSGAVSILGGANDTFVAGSGSATVDAPIGNNDSYLTTARRAAPR